MKVTDTQHESDKDTLAKIALATAAGLITAAGGKKIYQMYKKKQLLKKYTDDSQKSGAGKQYQNEDLFQMLF